MVLIINMLLNTLPKILSNHEGTLNHVHSWGLTFAKYLLLESWALFEKLICCQALLIGGYCGFECRDAACQFHIGKSFVF